MSQEELRFDNYVRAVWRAKWLIIVASIAAAGIAAYLTHRQPAQYRAVALIEIGRVWKEPLEDYYVTEKVVNDPGFLKQAAAKSGFTPRQLKHAVRAEVLEGGGRRNRYPVLLQITATSESEDAAQLADAAAKEVIARHEAMFEEILKPHLEQQMRLEAHQKELSSQPSARDLLLKVESELDQVRANNSLSNLTVTGKTHLIQEPTSEPVQRPSIWRPAAAAGSITAVALALGAALLAHFKHLEQMNSDKQTLA